ncbi:MAG: hypothetical protein ACRCZ0_12210 [Cetobacterium sp.]
MKIFIGWNINLKTQEQRMKQLSMDNENKDNEIQEKKDRIDELIARMDEEREERQLEKKNGRTKQKDKKKCF